MRKQKGLHNIKKICCLLTLLCLFLTACGSTKKTVILTTGFAKDEVFKVNDKRSMLPEILVYLTNIKNQYTSVYGKDILEVESEGIKLGDSIKDNALADISQIKAMNILADENNIELTDEEKSLVGECVEEYYTSLNSDEIQYLQITKEILENMYSEYARADKLYSELIKDINPEISDDEARTITVLHILIKTYSTDESGSKIEYSAKEKEEAYKRAKQIQEIAVSGEEDFTDLVEEYSEGDKGDYSFCLGETDPIFEEAAFNLGNNEISDVITTQYGYHIIKCISTFNREETELNKIKIADEQRKEVFGKKYDEFASTLITDINDELWNSIVVEADDRVKTQSFFEVYHKYFDNN